MIKISLVVLAVTCWISNCALAAGTTFPPGITPSSVGSTVAPLVNGTVPLANLPLVNTSGAGTYVNITVDPQGLITAIRNLTKTDITTALGFTPVPIGTVTGTAVDAGIYASAIASLATKASPTFSGSVSDTGTLTVTGLLSANGGVTLSTSPTITSAGTSLSTGTRIASSDNAITSCPAGTSVTLPLSSSTPIGTPVWIHNRCGGAVYVYPDTSSNTIENGTAGTCVIANSGVDYRFVRMTSTNWLATSGNYAPSGQAYGTAAPTSGTYTAGSEIINSNLVEHGTTGSKYITYAFICIASGSPGTWVPLNIPDGD